LMRNPLPPLASNDLLDSARSSRDRSINANEKKDERDD
jgi:hypothetical protein